MQSNTKRTRGDPERARCVAGANPGNVNKLDRCPLELGQPGGAGQQFSTGPLSVDPFLQGIQRVVIKLDATAETIDRLPSGSYLLNVLRIHSAGDRQ